MSIVIYGKSESKAKHSKKKINNNSIVLINFPQKQLKSFSIIICKLMLYLFYFIFDIEVHRVFKIISIESNPFSNFISVNIRKLYCIVLILVIINRYLLLNKTQLITDLPLSTLLLSILQKNYYYLIIK